MFRYTGGAFDCSEKGLLRSWRSQLRFRTAAHSHARLLAHSKLDKMHRFAVTQRGRQETARLYNEIRLLKNAFYGWFQLSIPDRLAFARANQLQIAHKQSLRLGALTTWARRLQHVNHLNSELSRYTRFNLLKSVFSSLSTWRLLSKQHSARLIWTENFRNSEDLRAAWSQWLLITRTRIHADTLYQRKLALNTLDTWRDLFTQKQDRRWCLHTSFNAWKRVRQTRQSTCFFQGQRILRVLNRHDAPNETLSRAMTQLGPEKQESLVALYKWRSRLMQVIQLELTGDGMILESLKRRIKRWRLAMCARVIPRQEPLKLARKLIIRLKRHLKRQRDRQDDLESELMRFYTNRAWSLQAQAFSRWESRFQVVQLGKVACDGRLIEWQSYERWRSLHRWKLQVALKIHQKCAKWTHLQRALTQWRTVNAFTAEAKRKRVLSRALGAWRWNLKAKRLAKCEAANWTPLVKHRSLLRWQLRAEAHKMNSTLANDFCFLTRGVCFLRFWRQGLQVKRNTQPKNRSIRVPTAHLLKPKKIEVPSLSDLNMTEDGVIIDGDMTLAELSV